DWAAAVEIGPATIAAGSITRSADPSTFQGLLLRSVIPELSVTMTGSWRPATLPGKTSTGLPTTTTDTSVNGPFGPACRVQTAFVLQMRSATVFACAPAQAAGPALFTGPQSLSVTRMTAFAAIDIAQVAPQPVSAKSMTIRSPGSSWYANPPGGPTAVADVEVGRVTSG